MFNLQNLNRINRRHLKLILFCCAAFGVFFFNAGAARAQTVDIPVTNTNDSGAGSFRQAIIDANASNIYPIIVFNFSNSGGVVRTVNLHSPLPDIVRDMDIYGHTISGYTNAPLIELNGAGAGANANGLTIRRGDVSIDGLIINRFDGNGIEAKCAGALCTQFVVTNVEPNVQLTVSGCYIGTDKFGLFASPNKGNGIYFEMLGRASNFGWTETKNRNVISGNGKNGILLRRNDSYFLDSDDDQYTEAIGIANNYIGVNVSGAVAVPNGLNGIAVENTGAAGKQLRIYVGYRIYGDTLIPHTHEDDDTNVISGNGANGVLSADKKVYFWVNYNMIGTNALGTADLGNGLSGVILGGDPTASDPTKQLWTFLHDNTISGNQAYGIETGNADANITFNKIGTNKNGDAAIGNGAGGVRVFGVNSLVQSNQIAGNGGNGLTVEIGADSSNVRQNYFGTNYNQTIELANTGNGISVLANAVTIGSLTNSNLGNIIDNSGTNGISAAGAANGVFIYRNHIGGSGGSGVLTASCATDVRVGSGATDAGNVIIFNAGAGVKSSNFCNFLPTTTTTVRRNSIFSNVGLGIDLGADGVQPNDAGDADEGPNRLQNYPILTNVTPTKIVGTLSSAPNQTYSADFYGSDSCHTSGSGEGKTYIGSVSIATNGSGNASFNLPASSGAVGKIVTATATDAGGNTSEFSPCAIIQSNAGVLSFSTPSSTVAENAGTASITVSRSIGSVGTITVDYAAANGTATAGQDYAATSGTLTFLNGETSKNIVVPVTNDTTDEPAETFTVALSNATGGASVGNPSAHVVTITDDDSAPTVSIGDVSAAEGDKGATTFAFNVSLSQASGFASSVNFSTADGTATAGVDYQSASGTVNFAAGETAKTISVTVNGDTIVEPNRTFFVNLSTALNTTIADGQGVGTILDDDAAAKLQFFRANYNVSESAGSAVVRVDRTGNSTGTVSVDYAATAGTATAAIDFTPVAGTLIFLNGQTTKTFTVSITDDQIAENDETINLTLSNPTGGAALGTQASATLTIQDDDAAGIEGDVSPRGTADGTVKSEDVSVIQGFQLGFGAPYLSNEFQRADTAPFITRGDGKISSVDVAQAEAYRLGFDLAPGGIFQTAAGPNAPLFSAPEFENLQSGEALNDADALVFNGAQTLREVRVVNATTSAGQTVVVPIEVDAQGDESVYGFGLSYDAAKLTNPVVTIGTAGGAVSSNTTQPGQIGVSVSYGGATVAMGSNRRLINVQFTVAANAPAGTTPVSFTDQPTFRETASAPGAPGGVQALTTTFTGGNVTISGPTAADVAVGGRVVSSTGRGIRNVMIIMTDGRGTVRVAYSTTFGYYRFADVPAGETYIFTVKGKRFQFAQATQVVSILEDTLEINFTAVPQQ